MKEVLSPERLDAITRFYYGIQTAEVLQSMVAEVLASHAALTERLAASEGLETEALGWEADALREAQNARHWREKYEQLAAQAQPSEQVRELVAACQVYFGPLPPRDGRGHEERYARVKAALAALEKNDG